MHFPSITTAEREKQKAALSSVIAAVGLTAMKLAVGLWTGSLGLLAEAAHSGLDVVAAVITLFAVRVSDRPADSNHHYGHGKVENLSALIETLLLLVTCIWIIYEAIERLFFKVAEVRATFWAFAVMAIAILVDFSRSRMLYRAAKKHNSQALEADALHFRTDIWSSAVVIVGLACMKVGEWVPSLAFLNAADSVAAIVVALIVVYVSVRLGKRTVQGLLDVAPAGMQERIVAAVEAMPGVIDCHHVRIRYSGPQPFVDVHVSVNGSQTLDQAHALTEAIEVRIQRLMSGADVTVHPEPPES